MPERIVWSKIASVIYKQYVERIGDRVKCKVCGEEIEAASENIFAIYSAIYKHFKDRHANIIDEVKAQLSGKGSSKTASLTEFA